MSLFHTNDLTIAHAGAITRIAETVHLWRERQHSRHELAQLSERDLNDVGLSRSEALHEAEKPFWRS